MIDLRCGDCLDLLPTLESESVDCVITDPPYPMIDRPYGKLTEAEWWDLMMVVCRETRRVLKPRGSAVFILQPNSRKVGSMRGWLWEFMAWACREWNMVQDAWWWNTAAVPEGHSIQGRLMRPSLKACVWLGPEDCHRDQEAVLWSESERNAQRRATERFSRVEMPSGHGFSSGAFDAAVRRGGVNPFNVLPVANTDSQGSSGAEGHGAGTPHELADWWVRYISPPGGVALDPFAGVGTIPIAALMRGRSVIAFERDAGYFETMTRRIERPHLPTPRRVADESGRHPLFAEARE